MHDPDVTTLQQQLAALQQRYDQQAAELDRYRTHEQMLDAQIANQIVELEEATTELERREQFLTAIFTHAPGMIFVQNPAGEFTMVNDAMQQFFAIVAGDLIGNRGDDVLAREVVQALAEDRAIALAQSASVNHELSFVRRDNSRTTLLMSLACLHNQARVPIAFVGFLTDISARKASEERLRLFKASLDGTPTPVTITRVTDGGYVYQNAANVALIGYDPAEAVHQPVANYFAHDAAKTQRDILQCIAEGTWSGEVELRHRDGTLIPVALVASTIYADDGTPLYITGFSRDLRPERAAEAERQHLHEKIVAAQQAVLREISTPLIPITDRVVILPLIGTVDSRRATQMMDTILHGIGEYHADTVILDITGVRVVDTQVANAFISTATAARLLGARLILTGIQPQIAATLVALGIDLTTVTTYRSLQAAIAATLRR